MTQVLITRPQESAGELAALLRSRGLVPIVMPLYTFSALQPAPESIQACSAAEDRKLVVFTSPRAVRFGLPHLGATTRDGLEFAAIGNATQAALQAQGIEVHVRAMNGFTSEDLLRSPGLAAEPGQAVIFCAPGGREALASGLRAKGWKVHKAMVYERIALEPATEQIKAINTACELFSVWTSISALELARQQLPEQAWKKVLCTRALVVSPRIKHHLQQLGADQVELADGPANIDLLRSIMRLDGSGERR